MAADPSLHCAVVAITGAGRGIGRGLAQAFAQRGARLVVSDIHAQAAQACAAELCAQGAEAIALQADVRSAADNAAQVHLAVARYGRLDIAICNAGIVQIKPLLELDAADWERMFAINVTGAFLTLQAAARHMLTQAPRSTGRPRGKIILLASIAGRSGAGPLAPLMAPYRASKAAVISMAQSAAMGLAPHINVNAICPGLVETDMWQHIDTAVTGLRGEASGQAWQRGVANVPMGRGETPADVANLALFLASSAADYMTGQAINIDGGLMMN